MAETRMTEALGSSHESSHVPALRISVQGSGSESAEAFVDVSSLAAMRVHIGTSSTCDLRIAGDPAVSRRHLAIEPSKGSSFRVLDLGSTNGTLLNGVPIVEAFVRPNDSLRIGQTVLRVQAAEVERAQISSTMEFGRLVGASDAMRRLYLLCERLARSSVPTLIEGERGTGKESLAESLHAASQRPGGFLVLDCGAGDARAVAVELFGDESGPGLYERADQGTLVLDEVGELPGPLQQKLARVIERGELRRVNDRAIRKSSVRIIATTRTDLDRLVNAGSFDEHLLGTLSVTRLMLPPLRHREGDIRLLARWFAEELGASLDDALLTSFEEYTWPGNVGELKAAVLKHVALGELGAAAAAFEPPSGSDWLVALLETKQPFSVMRRLAIEEFERRYVEVILADHGGNVTSAAAASGLALRHFQRVKSRHGGHAK